MRPDAALSRPLFLSDGRCLRTLADARKMVLTLTPEEQAQPRWQALVQALITDLKTDDADHVATLTSQLEQALSEPPFGSVRLAQKALAAPDNEASVIEASVIEATGIKRPPDYGVVTSSELLSLLAVGLLSGMIALALP